MFENHIIELDIKRMYVQTRICNILKIYSFIKYLQYKGYTDTTRIVKSKYAERDSNLELSD